MAILLVSPSAGVTGSNRPAGAERTRRLWARHRRVREAELWGDCDYLLDTSALVKHYHAEVGTPKVRAILAEPGAELLIARLATVEILSGFATKVRTGVFPVPDYHRLRGLFLADVKRRLLRPVRLLNAHYQLAGDLITQHALGRQLRTLDALQLAVALRVHQATPLDHFVSADQRLCDVALLEGLTVLNPELTP